MQVQHFRRYARQAVIALALLTLTSVQSRAEHVMGAGTASLAFAGVNGSFNPILSGNSDGGAVGTIQDSSIRQRDTTGQYKRDSLFKAWKERRNLRDSINRARADSMRNAHGHRDTVHHRDTTIRIHRDSLRSIRDSVRHLRRDSMHVRDSLHKADRDSLIKHFRDSLHVRDSIIHQDQDSLHVRDSINHAVRDSIERAMHDAQRIRDSINHAVRDSLNRALRDSLHRLDSIRHANGDTTHHGAHGVIGAQSDLGKISATPTVLALTQNYPNPFGGSGTTSTSIEFNVPTAQNVNLTVYNAAGQYVTTLVDGFTSAGLHGVAFDASNLPAGIYFYKLATESGTMTKRMIKLH